ncbi:MAG: SCP2 sterol-binding domain-containing protein [Proteobacteria bacterium]|nr:SCP2 sterol-binding domain-containing protein [Pseudomonadota bacterium]
MAEDALLVPLTRFVNRQVAASTPARALLAELAGRSFAIALETPLGGRLARLRLAASADGLALARDEEPADATVTGSPLGLAALLAGRREGRVSMAGVTVSGDAEVAAAFEKLLWHARPELEAELARLVGEVPAHLAGEVARGAFDWGRRAAGSLARNVGEYLLHEGRDVLPRAELEPFHAAVDALREDVDRAAARLERLERRAAGRTPAP